MVPKRLLLITAIAFAPLAVLADESDDDYIRRVSDQAKKKWAPSKTLPSNLSVVVHFKVNLDGTASSIVVHKSSGNAAADRSAVIAVQSAGPYPLPPDKFHKMKEPLLMELTFNVKSHLMRLNGQDVRNRTVQSSGGWKISNESLDSKIEQRIYSDRNATLNAISKIEQELRTGEKLDSIENSTNGARLANLAELYQKLQDWATAERLLLRALPLLEKPEQKNDYSRAAITLAETFYASNALDKAETWALKASESPGTTEAQKLNLLKLRAKILYKTNRVAEANQIYAELSKRSSK